MLFRSKADDYIVDRLIEALNKFSQSEIQYFIDEDDDIFTPENEEHYEKALSDLKKRDVISLEQLETGNYIV